MKEHSFIPYLFVSMDSWILIFIFWIIVVCFLVLMIPDLAPQIDF